MSKQLEVGVTVVKEIVEFRYKCPSCGAEIAFAVDDYDVRQLFDGEFDESCPECDASLRLFYEDEL